MQYIVLHIVLLCYCAIMSDNIYDGDQPPRKLMRSADNTEATLGIEEKVVIFGDHHIHAVCRNSLLMKQHTLIKLSMLRLKSISVDCADESMPNYKESLAKFESECMSCTCEIATYRFMYFVHLALHLTIFCMPQFTMNYQYANLHDTRVQRADIISRLHAAGLNTVIVSCNVYVLIIVNNPNVLRTDCINNSVISLYGNMGFCGSYTPEMFAQLKDLFQSGPADYPIVFCKDYNSQFREGSQFRV